MPRGQTNRAKIRVCGVRREPTLTRARCFGNYKIFNLYSYGVHAQSYALFFLFLMKLA